MLAQALVGSTVRLGWVTVGLALAVLFVVRPVAVYVSLAGVAMGRSQKALGAWFGMRGVGSVYYLVYAVSHGFRAAELRTITSVVLPLVAISVVLHGFSVTPLMRRYER